MNDNRQNSTGTVAASTISLAGRFRTLASTWRTETAHLSSAREMTQHPAYQEIIEMGSAAVPLLLRELEQEPDHWFGALKAITGADPVRSEDRGRIELMAQAWLNVGICPVRGCQP